MNKQKSKLIFRILFVLGPVALLNTLSCRSQPDLKPDDSVFILPESEAPVANKNFELRESLVMGTKAQIFIDKRSREKIPLLFKAFQKVENYYSNYRPDSLLMRFRKNAEIALPPDFTKLLNISEKVCRESHGVFNVKVAPLTENLYAFNRGVRKKKNTEELIRFKKSATHQVDEVCSIDIKNEARLLDFGGIGKGYALDEARKIIDAAEKALLKISGDIYCSHRCHFNILWPKSVQGNRQKDFQRSYVTCHPGSTISTSGNYNIYRGTSKNNHLLDLKKGHSQQGTSSMTVVGLGSSARIDGMTTALSIMAPKVRREIQFKNMAWLHIDQTGTIETSKNFKQFFCSP